MSMTSEARRLTEQFRDEHHNRVAAVTDAHDNAKRFLADVRAAHHNMADEQRKHFHDYMHTFRRNMAAVMTDLHSMREHLADTQQQRLSEMSADRRRMGAEERAQLHDHMKALRQGVADVRGELHSAHERMADELHRRLDHMGVAREKAGQHLRHKLVDEHKRRSADVRAIRSEFKADHGHAQKTWAAHHKAARAHQGKAAAAHAREPAPEPAPAPAAKEPEDLTTIPGIGPSRLERLNASGIRTLADLAQADPEAIRAALGQSARLVNVDEWIAAARKQL